MNGLYSEEVMFGPFMQRLGMVKVPQEGGQCGAVWRGDGQNSEGRFWCYGHLGQFYITNCNFLALRDLHMVMPPIRYIDLRWARDQVYPGGRLTAFLEEDGNAGHAILKAGTQVSYIDVMYLPAFYEQALPGLLTHSKTATGPADILKSMNTTGNWPPAILQLFMELDAYRGKGAASQLYHIAKALELMSLLLQAKEEKMGLRDVDIPGILAVTEHINQHFAEDIRQKDLVSIANMSDTKLKILFKTFTGKTISEYLLAKRMERAMHLLATGGTSVEEISRVVGYDTPTGFATAFRKVTGEAPRQYRAKMAFHLNTNPTLGMQNEEKPGVMPSW